MYYFFGFSSVFFRIRSIFLRLSTKIKWELYFFLSFFPGFWSNFRNFKYFSEFCIFFPIVFFRTSGVFLWIISIFLDLSTRIKWGPIFFFLLVSREFVRMDCDFSNIFKVIDIQSIFLKLEYFSKFCENRVPRFPLFSDHGVSICSYFGWL